ncbi:hypothetical protein DFJ74DRAFT_36362 [Hyaloraphidium curvatum]|nr:hypothetical protein DFJ74DRAFT_36362 [Hyaloraphidium curvatum]
MVTTRRAAAAAGSAAAPDAVPSIAGKAEGVPRPADPPVLLSFLYNALWPLSSLFTIFFRPPPPDAGVPFRVDIKPIADDWRDHFLTVGAVLPRLWISALAWHVEADANFRDAVGDRRALFLRILLRDALITFGIAVPWDFLFHRLKRDRLAATKYNRTYSQRFAADAFWTGCSVLVMAVIEMWCWVRVWGPKGRAAYPGNGLGTVAGWLWVLSMPYWRIAHFYCIHRLIHPWRTKTVPDLGRFLYRHVHSLHHKAYNPTAMSALRMHPVESALYFSAALVPVLFGAHPMPGFLYCLVDEDVGALLGHDGFGPVEGKGSFPHWLHHDKFEINYGENLVPLDWLFGTYGDGTGKTPDPLDGKQE